jgi:hypothetical protein
VEENVGFLAADGDVACRTRLDRVRGSSDILLLLILRVGLCGFSLDRRLLAQVGVGHGEYWIPHGFHEILPNVLDDDLVTRCGICDYFALGRHKFILVGHRRAILLVGSSILLVKLTISLCFVFVEVFDKLLDVWDWVGP